MQIHELQRNHPYKKKKIVGRGGKRGTYSGRGIKGQKARAGHRIRPQLRDEIKKLHKKRGYGIHRARSVRGDKKPAAVVSLSVLERACADGNMVTPAFLREKGLISRRQERERNVKILANGTFTKKISVSGCAVSGSAQKAIESAGGAIQN